MDAFLFFFIDFFTGFSTMARWPEFLSTSKSMQFRKDMSYDTTSYFVDIVFDFRPEF